MRRAGALIVLAVLAVASASVVGSGAAFTATIANPASTFATAADWTAPAVTLTAPADDATTNTTPTFSGAAGTASGDASTITVDIFSGATAAGAPVQTGTATRSGATWTTTATTLTAGTYTVRVTQTDGEGNTGTATRTFTVDAGKPKPTMVSAVNGGAGAAGRLNQGDKITYTFSEPIAPTSVLSSFTSSSAAVIVRFYDDSSNYGDSFTVLDASGQATVKLDAGSFWGIDGGVFTGRNYVTDTVSFAATMTRSADGRSFTVVLGRPDFASRIVAGPAAAADMTWAPKTGPTDLAGNALANTNWITESDEDREF